jgi:cell wall assembly regulator SMI1
MRDTVVDLWDRVTACLGEHGSSLRVRDGASEAAIAELEAGLGVELPDDFKDWLRLHDGEDHAEDRVEWLPAGGRLLPVAVILERWRDEQEWVEPDDEGFDYVADDERIRCVVRHPKRIVIAGNQWGDGDNTYLDLIPGPSGVVGQVIVATTECDFEVVGTSFLDFLSRWVSAFEAGTLSVRVEDDAGPRVDWTEKANPWDRWEAALRDAAPL